MLTKKFLLNLDENLSKTFCVTDVETTGQKPNESEIIEIASVKVINGSVLDKFSSFVKPNLPIPPFITKITGIENSHVLNAPRLDPVLKEWSTFIKGSDFFCAHNIMFDYDFIFRNLRVCNLPVEELRKLKFFCTVKTARLLLPELPSRKLADLIEHYKIKVSNRHRALDDAMATAEILLIFFEEIKKRKSELLEKIESMQNDKIKTFEAAEYLSVPKEKIYDMVKFNQINVYETYITKNGYEGYLFLRKDIEEMVQD